MSTMSVCNYSRVLLQGRSKDASLRASTARVTGSPSAKALRTSVARTSARKSVARFVTRSDMEADVEESLRDKKPKVVAANREKFAVIGSGQHQCKACSYVYDQAKGDSDFPVSPGTTWKQLPDDWACPVCGADKPMFEALGTEVAGFVENQGYGLGANGMTGGQKSALIYGSLALLFGLFISGYLLD